MNNDQYIPEAVSTYNLTVPEVLDLSHHINSITSFLFLIEQFRNEFKQRFSDIAQELETFKNNFNCGCKNKIIDFIKNNELEVLQFTKTFFNDNLGLRGHMNLLAQESNYIDVSGTIETIDDTPEEWVTFTNKAANQQYRFKSMNLIKDGSKLKIYFL